MKEIFVGSSKEGLDQATQMVAVLSETKDVKPLLWTDCFKLGDITFLTIENIARRGAREIDLSIQCPPEEPGVLRGRFSSEVGGNIYSKAAGRWNR